MVPAVAGFAGARGGLLPHGQEQLARSDVDAGAGPGWFCSRQHVLWAAPGTWPDACCPPGIARRGRVAEVPPQMRKDQVTGGWQPALSASSETNSVASHWFQHWFRRTHSRAAGPVPHRATGWSAGDRGRQGGGTLTGGQERWRVMGQTKAATRATHLYRPHTAALHQFCTVTPPRCVHTAGTCAG